MIAGFTGLNHHRANPNMSHPEFWERVQRAQIFVEKPVPGFLKAPKEWNIWSQAVFISLPWSLTP
jgi:hypothetical protein